MSISNTPRLKDLHQLTPLNEHEKNNTKGGYSFSCEEKKRNLMNLSVFTDAGVLIDTIKGVTAAGANAIMATYSPTISIATLRRA